MPGARRGDVGAEREARRAIRSAEHHAQPGHAHAQQGGERPDKITNTTIRQYDNMTI